MPKSIIFGAIFGLIAPFIGLFAGLQVSVVLGSILTFPLGLLYQITGTPIGMMSAGLLILGWLVSILVWAAIFYGVSRLIQAVQLS